MDWYKVTRKKWQIHYVGYEESVKWNAIEISGLLKKAGV
jgi:hypothetical protein